MTPDHLETSSEMQLCDNCGKPTFFNYSMWSSGPDGGTHTHGYGPKACESAAVALERMPIALNAAVQALVETEHVAARLIFDADDDEYRNVGMLQNALHSAYGRAADGVYEVSAALKGAHDSDA